jgi:replicative DNA helicase
MQATQAARQSAVNPAQTAADYLIGNLWFRLDRLPVVAAHLEPDALPDGPAKLVYQEMYQLLKASRRLSTSTLQQSLDKQGVDWRSYVGYLQTIIIAPEEDETVLLDHANEINEAANKAEMRNFLAQAMSALDRPDTRVEDVAPGLVQKMSGTNRGLGNSLLHISEYSKGLREKIERWRSGVVEGRSTGFKTIDKVFRLVDTALVVIAARPSMGKSALAFQIGKNVAEELRDTGENGCVAFFSAEMSGELVEFRMACAMAGIDSELARRNQTTPEENARIDETLDYIDTLPIYIDETPSPGMGQVYFKAAMIHARQPIRLLVFDFVELGGKDVDDKEAFQSEELRISTIIRRLADMAKAFKCPVIALSQLNREVENTADKLPTLRHLRGSGMIEQRADVVAFIMRPEYYVKRGAPCAMMKPEHEKGVAYLKVDKNRLGDIAMKALAFTERFTRFGDLSHEDETHAPPPPEQRRANAYANGNGNGHSKPAAQPRRPTNAPPMPPPAPNIDEIPW